ncbi:MAG: NAD-dependent epimerase/dehydratase family protein [Alphaproteobacteria bacterium]|nr:NAD-dependent epimerase/dehydratase family protein [Alphaproteobacteria bacterium]
MSKYLVTGGCGFIGSHLVNLLLAGGHTVRVLDDLSTGRRETISSGVELVVADVADRAALDTAMRDVDGCFHLAAIASVEQCTRDWAGSHRVNLTGTIAVFEAAAVRRIPVVYTSSAAVFGSASERPLRETTPATPISAYGADKLGCELHARVAGLVYDLPTAGIRPFNVYGPGQDPRSPYSGVISLFCGLVSEGKTLTINGDGQQVRDFIYVDDVARVFAAAMGGVSTDARIYCACTGHPTSVLELAKLISELSGVAPKIAFAEARRGDVRNSVGDPARARSELGFSASVDLRSGLRRTLEWMASERGAPVMAAARR